MINKHTTRLAALTSARGRSAMACGLAATGVVGMGWLAADARAQQQLTVEVQQLEVQEAQAIQGDILIEDELDDILGPDYQPGFQFPRGENRELLDESLNAFHAHLDNGEWETAFRRLIDLTESARHAMAPLGESSVYMPVRRALQQRLRELPPEGRRAFQQFYDAQAREMLARALAHLHPGSEEQVRQAREVYELFLTTSVGDRAGNLLGDLYFERGQFAQAQACWRAVLEHHPGSDIPELDLQYKRVLALQRAGRTEAAHELADQVAMRFAGRGVDYGGGQPDAAAALRALLGEVQDENAAAAGADTAQPDGLPERGADPAWQMTFVDDATQQVLNGFTSGRNYYGPTDLRSLMPPAAADDQRLYAHWHGVVFAMDLSTGKLLWRTGRFTDAARGLPERMGSAAGTPRGYKIALTDDLVLVQTANDVGRGRPDRFALSAYDKLTGERAWDSSTLPAWSGQGFCGQPLVVGGQLYAITHPAGRQEDGTEVVSSRSLTLHLLDPVSGRPRWSLPLGDADVHPNPYTESVWLPQPTMLMHGRDLFVLTNNGALIAVDPGAAEVAWAARLVLPEGATNPNRYYNYQPPSANLQGAGSLVMRDGVLYAKEARSSRIYAINPANAEVLWERPADNPDAELIGVDEQHLYVMAQALRAYPLPDRDTRGWNNRQIGGPSVGSGIFTDDDVYLLGGNRLFSLSLENGDPTARFSSRSLRGNGGHVLLAGDKLIVITQRDITAFQVPTRAAAPQDAPPPPGDASP